MKAAEKSHIILIGATRLTPDFLKKPMEASDNGKSSLKPLNPWREVTAHLGFHIWWTIFQTWRWNENIFRETKTDRIHHQQNSLKLEKGKWSRWKHRSGERNVALRRVRCSYMSVEGDCEPIVMIGGVCDTRQVKILGRQAHRRHGGGGWC